MYKAQDDTVDIDALKKIIEEEYNNDHENVIMILQAIQRRYDYLPMPALEYLSQKIGIPLSKIYGVATFYSTFNLEPQGPVASTWTSAPGAEPVWRTARSPIK